MHVLEWLRKALLREFCQGGLADLSIQYPAEKLSWPWEVGSNESFASIFLGGREFRLVLHQSSGKNLIQGQVEGCSIQHWISTVGCPLLTTVAGLSPSPRGCHFADALCRELGQRLRLLPVSLARQSLFPCSFRIFVAYTAFGILSYRVHNGLKCFDFEVLVLFLSEC